MKQPSVISQNNASSTSATDLDTTHAPDVSGAAGSVEDNTEAVVNQQLVWQGLVDFFQHGIGSQTWTLFDRNEEARMCYVGVPVSNLAFLVSQERGGDSSNLHYPIPQIHRVLPWKPDPKHFALELRRHAESDLSSLPSRNVRDALVDAFFQEVHPGFPIVDEAEFRASYASAEAPPPLLLLQAIFLAGAHVCQHTKVAQSRAFVKATLFHRAKTLWDLRYENDRVTLVQAALLFSWHIEGADNVSANSYYWISVACGIAFGLGMHRNLAASSTSVMPPNTKRVFRRVWWTLFQAAVLSSLDHGRPLLTRRDDSDQPCFKEEDLVEIDGKANGNVNLQYSLHNIALCEIIAEILDMFSPGSQRKASPIIDTSQIDARLASWLMALPSGNDFYIQHLKLHYNAAVLHLHRTVTHSESSFTVTNSQKLCGGAAENIVSIFRGMINAGTIRRCYFTALTAIMAAAIHFTRDMRLAITQNSTLLILHSQAQLESCFPVLKELAVYWTTANALLKLFQHVLERAKSTTTAHSGNTIGIEERQIGPSQFIEQNILPADWDYIFSTLHMDHLLPEWSDC